MGLTTQTFKVRVDRDSRDSRDSRAEGPAASEQGGPGPAPRTQARSSPSGPAGKGRRGLGGRGSRAEPCAPTGGPTGTRVSSDPGPGSPTGEPGTQDRAGLLLGGGWSAPSPAVSPPMRASPRRAGADAGKAAGLALVIISTPKLGNKANILRQENRYILAAGTRKTRKYEDKRATAPPTKASER